MKQQLDRKPVVSEPALVPRTTDAAAGDGVLLSVAWRERAKRSDLLVFEALDIATEPVAIAQLPHRVPFGFHGTWRPDQ